MLILYMCIMHMLRCIQSLICFLMYLFPFFVNCYTLCVNKDEYLAKKLQLVGDFVLRNSYRSSAVGPRWETSVRRPLPTNCPPDFKTWIHLRIHSLYSTTFREIRVTRWRRSQRRLMRPRRLLLRHTERHSRGSSRLMWRGRWTLSCLRDRRGLPSLHLYMETGAAAAAADTTRIQCPRSRSHSKHTPVCIKHL